MNRNQQKIKKLLAILNPAEELTPAPPEKIAAFIKEAKKHRIPPKAIRQIVELYEVSNAFYSENLLAFFEPDDMFMFEMWREDERVVWLGLHDFYCTFWGNGKFALGDASNFSFSEEYEFDTLVEFFEGCIREVERFKED
jgi:hypothetical protein